jgi:hypothetical protein
MNTDKEIGEETTEAAEEEEERGGWKRLKTNTFLFFVFSLSFYSLLILLICVYLCSSREGILRTC